MGKLNLVIADMDGRYAKGLSDYINCNHYTAFLASCFTKPDALETYLEQKQQADILMISPDFYDISLGYPGIKLKVLLTDGAISGDFPGFQFLNKFSTGEKLLGDVVYLYSQLNPNELRLSPYSKDTRLIGVYSAAGGAGKTTIASSLSTACSSMGMQVFYLNLESIQSTGVFFTAKSKRTLSYIFYYLKERSTNLSFRMQGIKSTDAVYGVQYFNPPDSPLEYEELNVEELELLLKGIREMNIYSYVFIDMSSSFDSKNCKILELCDRIILLNLQEPIAMHKCRKFLNELVKLGGTEKENISDKLITVINRYRGGSGEAGSTVHIPEYSKAYLDAEDRIVIDDEGFRNAIKQLIGKLSEI